MSSFHDELLNFVTSVITPGHRHPWSLRIMNFALLGLAATLLFGMATGSGTIHHVIMLVMSLGLLVAVHWFIRAVDALPKEEKKELKQE
jgi:hypothetical protein